MVEEGLALIGEFSKRGIVAVKMAHTNVSYFFCKATLPWVPTSGNVDCTYDIGSADLGKYLRSAN